VMPFYGKRTDPNLIHALKNYVEFVRSAGRIRK
jgi:hypothetical protein